MSTTTITFRVSEEERNFFEAMAKFNNKSLSELVREKALEALEDEYDLQSYKQAMKEYRKNPVSYSIDEVREELGL